MPIPRNGTGRPAEPAAQDSFGTHKSVESLANVPCSFHPWGMEGPRKRWPRGETAVGGGEARIWPHWVRSLGAMIEARAQVRFACPACKRLYDVDLASLAILKGREWTLVDRRARCKASRCRASGRFVAATAGDQPFLLLSASERLPDWLTGARPVDHEPPHSEPPTPPAPPGVDPVRWAYARDDRTRKRLVREARG